MAALHGFVGRWTEAAKAKGQIRTDKTKPQGAALCGVPNPALSPPESIAPKEANISDEELLSRRGHSLGVSGPEWQRDTKAEGQAALTAMIIPSANKKAVSNRYHPV